MKAGRAFLPLKFPLPWLRFYKGGLSALGGQVIGEELNGKLLFYLDIIFIYTLCKFKINLKHP